MRAIVLSASLSALSLSSLNAAPLALQRLAHVGGQHTAQTVVRTKPLPPANFTYFDFPGTSITAPYAINPSAMPNAKQVIVGGWATTTGSNGFLLKLTSKKAVMSEGYQTIEPALTNSQALGINDAGHIVGSFTTDTTHGYLLAGGNLTQIDVPYQGAAGTWATGMNNCASVAAPTSSTRPRGAFASLSSIGKCEMANSANLPPGRGATTS